LPFSPKLSSPDASDRRKRGSRTALTIRINHNHNRKDIALKRALIDQYQASGGVIPLPWFNSILEIGAMQKTSDIIWQDTQHQVLFTLIDQIKEEPFDPDILVRLKLYAEHHFILEETYMETLEYPHADAHIEAHNRFREELAAMLDTDPSMHLALQVSLSDFLYKWLKLHVLGIDKKLEDFVMKSSVK
jgi:hemerythrin